LRPLVLAQSKLPLDKARPVLCICLSAHRSIAAQKYFEQQGFKAVQLKGGMKEWRKMGLPEVKEEAKKGAKSADADASKEQPEQQQQQQQQQQSKP
jgi:tRNA 2-selenouridine synthase SelU